MGKAYPRQGNLVDGTMGKRFLLIYYSTVGNTSFNSNGQRPEIDCCFLDGDS